MIEGYGLFMSLCLSATIEVKSNTNVTHHLPNSVGKAVHYLGLEIDWLCSIEEYARALIQDYHCEIIYRSHFVDTSGSQSCTDTLLNSGWVWLVPSPSLREACDNCIWEKLLALRSTTISELTLGA